MELCRAVQELSFVVQYAVEILSASACILYNWYKVYVFCIGKGRIDGKIQCCVKFLLLTFYFTNSNW